MSWRWRSAGEVTKNDFGSPTFGFGHTYCLTANDDAGGTYKVVKVKDGCDALGCWTETSRGFKYASAAGAPDRLKIVLTAGTPARIVVRTKGTRGTVPPLPMTQPVHVEFFRSNDLQKCLDATFDANVSQNTSQSFTATSE